MAEAPTKKRGALASAVRPKDRPARRPRPSTYRGSAGARSGAGRVGRRSSLNPGFPRWAIVALVLVVVAVSGGWIVFASSWFGVREVQVSGTAVLTADEVRHAVDLTASDALATVDTDVVAARVESLAPVKTATVTKSWPSTLIVKITERQPVATVLAGGVPWLIDEGGMPYVPAERVGDQAKGLLPLQIDNPSPKDLATRQAVAVIAGLNAQTKDLVDHVTAPSAAQVTLVLHDGRQVIWGDSSRMNDKLTMLPAVLEHAGNIYDISSPTNIVIT